MHFRSIVFSILFLSAISGVYSQQLAQKDYERAVSFLRANNYNKTAFNLHTEVKWFTDNKALYFIDHSKDKKVYKSIALDDFKTSLLFDHTKLAVLLSEESGDTISANAISISNIEKVHQLNTLSFEFKNKRYDLDLSSYLLKPIIEDKEDSVNTYESESPDGQWVAFTKDFNLFIRSKLSKEEHQLTFDGAKDYEYASYYGWFDKMEGENGKRPKRFTVSWSPDSKYIRANLIDFTKAEKMYMLDYSIDSLFKPKLLSYYRGSPGDTTMVHVQPFFFDVESKKQLDITLPKNTHINSVGTFWLGDPKIVYASFAERGFKKQHILQVNLKTQQIDTILTESSKTNIDDFEYWVLEKHNKILFLSQRSGWRQLYTVDIGTKKVEAITHGEYVINNVVHQDQDAGVIYISASGTDTNMNPYHQQIYRVTLDGEVDRLTPESLHHRVSFSPNGKFFVDNFSSVQKKTRTVLRSSEIGEIVAEVTKADVSKLTAKGWNPPMIFGTLGKDGKSMIHGAIWRPTNFDPEKKYPIIDHSYTGPHTQVYPKSYDAAFNNQALAELGFVVIMVDGLGTTGRSKAFQSHSYKNMGNNLEDHVLAIKKLAERNQWIDVNKVGIYGHSAGGYDAGHAMLAFPDFYKVGVASSADHDFRMEKAWWPEMYMGWPVDSTYQEVSNITMASNLKGKLLLVHGSLDDNVNASATFKLAEALIKADKEFDLLIIPSQRHGYQGQHRKYFIKKRWNYFVKHLKAQEGIWDFEW